MSYFEISQSTLFILTRPDLRRNESTGASPAEVLSVHLTWRTCNIKFPPTPAMRKQTYKRTLVNCMIQEHRLNKKRWRPNHWTVENFPCHLPLRTTLPKIICNILLFTQYIAFDYEEKLIRYRKRQRTQFEERDTSSKLDMAGILEQLWLIY